MSSVSPLWPQAEYHQNPPRQMACLLCSVHRLHLLGLCRFPCSFQLCQREAVTSERFVFCSLSRNTLQKWGVLSSVQPECLQLQGESVSWRETDGYRRTDIPALGTALREPSEATVALCHSQVMGCVLCIGAVFCAGKQRNINISLPALPKNSTPFLNAVSRGLLGVISSP